MNYLRPSIKHGRITKEEEAVLGFGFLNSIFTHPFYISHQGVRVWTWINPCRGDRGMVAKPAPLREVGNRRALRDVRNLVGARPYPRLSKGFHQNAYVWQLETLGSHREGLEDMLKEMKRKPCYGVAGLGLLDEVLLKKEKEKTYKLVSSLKVQNIKPPHFASRDIFALPITRKVIMVDYNVTGVSEFMDNIYGPRKMI